MIYVYTGLTIWLIAISATIYYAFLLPNAIERQEDYVALLTIAYDNHPLPDYAETLRVESARLERLRRRVWRVEGLA